MIADEQYQCAVDMVHLLYAALVGITTPGGGEQARALAESAMRDASAFLGLATASGAEQDRGAALGRPSDTYSDE